jgi:VanZ family protein
MNSAANHNPAVYAAGSPVPNRRHYAILALLFAAIAIYGSIVPLHLHRQTLAEAVERFRQVLAEPITLKSRSDWLANFLLQLPFGFFLMAAICCDRPYFAAPALPVTIVSCVVLAGVVEFAQLYFPPRVASLNDIAAQTLGGTAGAFGWWMASQRLTDLARRLWHDFGSRSTAVPLLSVYLFIVSVRCSSWSCSPGAL